MINMDFVKNANKAICIDNTDTQYLTLNKKYYVQETCNGNCLTYNDEGVLHNYCIDRFKLLA
jgi:hypothetical protein